MKQCEIKFKLKNFKGNLKNTYEYPIMPKFNFPFQILNFRSVFLCYKICFISVYFGHVLFVLRDI